MGGVISSPIFVELFHPITGRGPPCRDFLIGPVLRILINEAYNIYNDPLGA